MRTLWCWRCRMHLPMLDDDEWAVLMEARDAAGDDPAAPRAILERESARRALPPPGPIAAEGGVAQWQWYMTAGFEMFTGMRETNPSAVWHHRASLYGPPCPACGKPLRTPRARLCAACGWGMSA